jgi:hypothetical protein
MRGLMSDLITNSDFARVFHPPSNATISGSRSTVAFESSDFCFQMARRFNAKHTPHYLDKKQRIATELGAVFAPANVETADFAGAAAAGGIVGKAMPAGKARKRAAR